MVGAGGGGWPLPCATPLEGSVHHLPHYWWGGSPSPCADPCVLGQQPPRRAVRSPAPRGRRGCTAGGCFSAVVAACAWVGYRACGGCRVRDTSQVAGPGGRPRPRAVRLTWPARRQGAEGLPEAVWCRSTGGGGCAGSGSLSCDGVRLGVIVFCPRAVRTVAAGRGERRVGGGSAVLRGRVRVPATLARASAREGPLRNGHVVQYGPPPWAAAGHGGLPAAVRARHDVGNGMLSARHEGTTAWCTYTRRYGRSVPARVGR